MSLLDFRRKRSKQPTAAQANSVRVLSLDEFLRAELLPRDILLEPWLPAASVCMVYAPRGIGKTFFGLAVAKTVATATAFLGWRASQPANVLYLDGEMAATDMQSRLKSAFSEYGELPEGFAIVTQGLQAPIMPNLATVGGQETLEPYLSNVDLIIVDNISCLCPTLDENSADAWHVVQQWAIYQRSQGRAVLFIHHAGKSGARRGTSKREDVMDTVIQLKPSSAKQSEDGAAFEVHFDKNRGFFGPEAQPFDARLEVSEDGWSWHSSKIEDDTFSRVVELTRDGMPQAAIARELKKNKGTISRHVARAREEGLI